MDKKLKEYKFSRRIDFIKKWLTDYEKENLISRLSVRYSEVKNLLTYEFRYKENNQLKDLFVSEKFTIVFDCFAIKQTIYKENADGTQQTIKKNIFIECGNEDILTTSENDLNIFEAVITE